MAIPARTAASPIATIPIGDDAMTPTWILVADNARARLFSLDAGKRRLEEIEAFVNVEGRMQARMMERDRPPRTHDRFGEGRHAIEPHASSRDKACARFAGVLRSALERGRVDHRYDRLVLIAPPRFLGTLNAALDKQLDACVALRIAKDLTHSNAIAIGAALPESVRGHAH
jgi:protein required for attachment to host cells